MNRKPAISADGSVVAFFLAVHIGLVAVGCFRHSPNLMEAVDLPAGLYHLETGCFRLREVNPPLVRTIAAIPVAAVGAERDWGSISSSPQARSEFAVGHDFIAANGERVFFLFAVARLACIPFTILGTTLCWLWARRMFGTLPGILAAGLWCFDPTILGHAETMNSDIPAAAMGLASVYFYMQWQEQPGWRNGVIAGNVLGLAMLTRTTLWILLPVLLGSAMISLARNATSKLRSFQLVAIVGLAFYIFNLGYAFEGTFRPLGGYSFVSKTFGGAEASPNSPSNRLKETALATIPLPLPTPFIVGVDIQRYDFENSDGRFKSYLRGEWSDRGWWYYYLYGLVVKWPLGTWVLLLIAAVSKLQSMIRSEKSPSGESLCFLSALAILTLVSSQTGFSMHFRYVLPMFPFVFILIGRAATSRITFVRVLVAALFVVSISASLATYPHTISYFNLLAGGPSNGHAHLLHSSIDWGQDLLEFRDWIRANGVADEITLAATGPTPHNLLGVESGSPPHLRWNDDGSINQSSGPVAGWHAVSANLLCEKRYAYFREFKPAATIGYSIRIYRLEPEAVREYRQRMGLSVP